jgi:hypothetical protein
MAHRTILKLFLAGAAPAAAALLLAVIPAPRAAEEAKPQASPAPAAQASPAPSPAAEAPPAPAPQASPAPAELPRIIRVVCTDRICGNCDGKCHKNSGHVAIDKKGHCACTPTEGGPLDEATRRAYEKNPPQ